MKNNSKELLYNNEIRRGCKDNFHAFLVKGAEFDGYYDIPFIPQYFDLKVNKLIAYDRTSDYDYGDGDVVHFYLDDQKFDGPRGVWNGLLNEKSFKRGFNVSRFKGVSAIITPDFSLYLDMPRVMQIWNVYRSRAIGYYLTQLGFNVIPNVRWTDADSYDFAFDGLYQGQIVAVGTLGCSKKIEDKLLLINGFVEMIKRINPTLVIVYGPVCDELQEVINKFNVNIKQFDSDISLFYGGKNHGNEE